MLFSRRSATSACAVALIVMAVTPYHRFSSSIGLASGAMTWLVILGACLAAFGHGVALRKGREIRRPKHLGAIGVSLVLLLRFPNGPTWPSMLAEILFHSCLRLSGCCAAFHAPRASLGRCSSHM